MNPDTPLMTGEEFLKLHGHESGVELVKGRVVREPRPGDPPLQETVEKTIDSPVLVVIRRSPKDRLNQLMRKAVEYLDTGVSVVVVLLPETKSAVIYRYDALPFQLGSEEELSLPEVLPGFAAPVRAFFE